MNRKTAIASLLIGLLLLMGSCVPIGHIIYHEIIIDPLGSYSLSDSGASDQTSFQATPGSLARFTIEAEITTDSVQEDPDSFDNEYIARFKFPVSYTISDAKGNVLIKDDTTLAWKDGGSITKSNETTTSTGGSLTASTNLDKFTVPSDGNVDINITINPDTTYKASYHSPQLHLYGGMINNTGYVISSVVMFIFGFLISIVGFIAFLTKTAQTSNQQLDANSSESIALRDKDTNQQAMMIQLSALAGYIIPFGNIILPVILWQVWRRNDAYVDKLGCEAVNFQLTMLLYYLASIALMLVLVGFVLIFVAMIFHITFIIIATVQAAQGVDYRYPLSIRFIKI